MTWTLHLGDCLEYLRTLPSGSVDAVVTDPPYAEIDRPYGRLSEVEWHTLMDAVVAQTRRILKPSGSAVFVIQPNSERIGRMRLWVFDFISKYARDWNLVQDLWWWNHTTAPTAHCQEKHGLMRPSLKPCVWFGSPDCYRNQTEILWDQSDSMRDTRLEGRGRVKHPSGQTIDSDKIRATVDRRGGVTPFNVWPISNGDSQNSAGANGHGAGTPFGLCDKLVRYISPPGGIVVDPFCGSGTVGMAAIAAGRTFWGCEKMPEYHAIATRRLKEAEAADGLFAQSTTSPQTPPAK